MKAIKALLSMLIVIMISGCRKITIGMNFSASDIECLVVRHMLFADGGMKTSTYEKKQSLTLKILNISPTVFKTCRLVKAFPMKNPPMIAQC